MRTMSRLIPPKRQGDLWEYVLTFGNGVGVTKIRGKGEGLAEARNDALEQLADLAEREAGADPAIEAAQRVVKHRTSKGKPLIDTQLELPF